MKTNLLLMFFAAVALACSPNDGSASTDMDPDANNASPDTDTDSDSDTDADTDVTGTGTAAETDPDTGTGTEAEPTIGDNPIISVLNEDNADPEILYSEGTYYVYPTTCPKRDWMSTDFKVYASTDLVHWVDRGIILTADDVPRSSTCSRSRQPRPTPRSTCVCSPPHHGIIEDPATGSAAGPLTGYLLKYGMFGAAFEIWGEQGIEMGRPSAIGMRGRIDGDDITVEIGGSCRVVGHATFRL